MNPVFAAILINPAVDVVLIVAALVIGAVVGILVGQMMRKKFAEAEIGSAEEEAKRLVEEGRKQAETLKKEAKLSAQEEIMKLKNLIESKGLRWSVVESLPVSEDIKTKGKNYAQHIENYKISLRNLGECGIDTVCYNFMPVLDWTRTELRYKHKGGGEGLYFDFPTFVAFDVFILNRELLCRAEKVTFRYLLPVKCFK